MVQFSTRSDTQSYQSNFSSLGQEIPHLFGGREKLRFLENICLNHSAELYHYSFDLYANLWQFSRLDWNPVLRL